MRSNIAEQWPIDERKNANAECEEVEEGYRGEAGRNYTNVRAEPHQGGEKGCSGATGGSGRAKSVYGSTGKVDGGRKAAGRRRALYRKKGIPVARGRCNCAAMLSTAQEVKRQATLPVKFVTVAPHMGILVNGKALKQVSRLGIRQ